MDRYQRVERPRPESVISENEIRVTTQGLVRNYISYATTLLQEKRAREIVLKGMGQAVSKTVAIAEILKKRTPGLHQDTSTSSVSITDVWEPIEEGLVPLEMIRHVSMISIALSTRELDKNSPGYQAPAHVEQPRRQQRIQQPQQYQQKQQQFQPRQIQNHVEQPRRQQTIQQPQQYQQQQPQFQPRKIQNQVADDSYGRGLGGRGRGRGWARGRFGGHGVYGGYGGYGGYGVYDDYNNYQDNGWSWNGGRGGGRGRGGWNYHGAGYERGRGGYGRGGRGRMSGRGRGNRVEY